MSWSVTLIGKPENVAKALEEEGASWDRQTKVEFDAARPALIALVRENFGSESLVQLQASGHGYAMDGEQINRTCSVKLDTFYAKLV